FILNEGGSSASLLEMAKWIWYPEGNPLQAVPQNITRLFRRTFEIKEKEIKSAKLFITADNEFKCKLNGQFVGEGNKWEEIYSFDVKDFLKAGRNEILVIARNGGDIPNPAGLICVLTIRYSDGDSQYLISDGSWESAIGDEWVKAMELGPYGIAPWGQIGTYPLYYDIEEICQLLRKLGIPPDYSYEPRISAGSIRYIHKSLPDAEVYFISNQEVRKINIKCFFRVKGMLPELWLPESGEIKRPEKFRETKEGTILSLNLEPLESIFVVFPRESSKRRWLSLPVRREPVVREIVEIRGEWEVHFPKGWGAPEKVTLPNLISWSEHPEEGVRFFSGTALYIKKFVLPRKLYSRYRRYI
ncbi:MAG: glycosylhydrolase-like jelly roll fold domain-containing protein, partial [bacterium]